MEDRRHGTARATEPFKKERSYNEQGVKPYGKGNYRARNSRNRSSESRFANKNERFRTGSGNKFRNAKRFNPKAKGKKKWKRQNSPPIVSDLQVADGKHRGKYLISSESPKARVTDRRLREALFRILFRQVRAGRVLDLCAGIGTIGIEAISRGALLSTFVERSARFAKLIGKNLEKLDIKTGHGEIFEIEAAPFLKKMAKRSRFWDLVYYGPPFDADYESVLKYFEKGVAIRPKGILVIEHHAEMFFPEQLGVLHRWKVVTEGEVSLSFYSRKR
ncbi:MAG: hypothetical protein HKN25_12230 [Pyrinomonadaceae bacterium]|nr:hypothetical protein [Pyrinomonadaceae bacterium]